MGGADGAVVVALFSSDTTKRGAFGTLSVSSKVTGVLVGSVSSVVAGADVVAVVVVVASSCGTVKGDPSGALPVSGKVTRVLVDSGSSMGGGGADGAVVVVVVVVVGVVVFSSDFTRWVASRRTLPRTGRETRRLVRSAVSSMGGADEET